MMEYLFIVSSMNMIWGGDMSNRLSMTSPLARANGRVSLITSLISISSSMTLLLPTWLIPALLLSSVSLGTIVLTLILVSLLSVALVRLLLLLWRLLLLVSTMMVTAMLINHWARWMILRIVRMPTWLMMDYWRRCLMYYRWLGIRNVNVVL